MFVSDRRVYASVNWDTNFSVLNFTDKLLSHTNAVYYFFFPNETILCLFPTFKIVVESKHSDLNKERYLVNPNEIWIFNQILSQTCLRVPKNRSCRRIQQLFVKCEALLLQAETQGDTHIEEIPNIHERLTHWVDVLMNGRIIFAARSSREMVNQTWAVSFPPNTKLVSLLSALCWL